MPTGVFPVFNVVLLVLLTHCKNGNEIIQKCSLYVRLRVFKTNMEMLKRTKAQMKIWLSYVQE